MSGPLTLIQGCRGSPTLFEILRTGHLYMTNAVSRREIETGQRGFGAIPSSNAKCQQSCTECRNNYNEKEGNENVFVQNELHVNASAKVPRVVKNGTGTISETTSRRVKRRAVTGAERMVTTSYNQLEAKV